MISISPFKALRPEPQFAKQVASRPYDVLTTKEAKVEADKKYAFEKRNNILIKQYSSSYTIAYDNMLNGMVERRMRQSIFAVASFWFTAWVNAGQPDLSALTKQSFSEKDLKEFEKLNEDWKNSKAIEGREHE